MARRGSCTGSDRHSRIQENETIVKTTATGGGAHDEIRRAFARKLVSRISCEKLFEEREESMQYLSYIVNPFTLNMVSGNAADAAALIKRAAMSAGTGAVDPVNALIAALAALAAGAGIYIYRHRRIGS